MEEVIVILAQWNFLPLTTSNLFLNSFLEHQLRQRNVPVMTAYSHITAANLEDVQLLARFPRGQVCSIAALRSDLELFVEARRQGFIFGNSAKYAFRNGYLPIAKMALESYDWARLPLYMEALRHNHPNLVIELWDPQLDAGQLLIAAADSQSSDCFTQISKFLSQLKPSDTTTAPGVSLSQVCARVSDFRIFKALISSSERWKSPIVTKHAARRGDLEFLSWLRQNDCPWTDSTTKAAAKAGHLELLQWAIANGCPLSEEALSSACKEGHFELVEWLLQQTDAGRPEFTLLKACEHSLAMVKLCLKHGVQWPANEDWLVLNNPSLKGALQSAVQRGDVELIEWLHEQGFTQKRGRLEFIAPLAAIYGHFELAKQWYARGSELPELHHVPRDEPGNLKFLDWLHERGAQVDKRDFFTSIILSCDVEMLQWAMARGIIPDNDEVSEYDMEVDPLFKTLWLSNFIGQTQG